MKLFFKITALLLSCGILPVSAMDADTVDVRFRQSKVLIDTAFCGNGSKLDSIFRKLAMGKPAKMLQHITITGAASPEGSVSFNNYLSKKRAEAIADVFSRHGYMTDDAQTSYSFLGRDWAGLRREVLADSTVPHRGEVLELLNQVVESTADVDNPLFRLKSIGQGESYRYLYKKIFPGLRRSTLILEYAELPQHVTLEPLPSIEGHIGPVVIPEHFECNPVIKPKVCRPFYLGIKTNLLSDVLLIPHIGADLYFGKGWSVTADWIYGWWDRDRTHYYWRAYGGTLGARRWFGRKADAKPLTGHHAGIYAGIVTYDFELGGTGIMGGIPHGTLWDRCNVVCGLEYGYSLPVAKRLNIDFTIGIGYLGGKYYKYIPKDGIYLWQSTHNLHWFGPTKAEVSLVWLVGCDNYNRMKGGKR